MSDYHHEPHCNASRTSQIGSEACSCWAGREIKRLRTRLVTARKAAIEECAKIAEKQYTDPAWHMIYRIAADSIASKIRAAQTDEQDKP